MQTSLVRAAIAAVDSMLAIGQAAAQGLDCGSGPLPKSYGKTPWLVYACSDEKSLVVVATEDNPGHPFFFKLFVKDGVRYVVGEGEGKKAVTAPAYDELSKLSEADLAALIKAARTPGAPQ